MLLAQTLPTTDVMLFGATILGLLAALRGNNKTFDKHFTQCVQDAAQRLDKVMDTHETVAKGIVKGLGGVKDSVDGLGVKIDKHGQRLKELIQHVKGPLNDTESDG